MKKHPSAPDSAELLSPRPSGEDDRRPQDPLGDAASAAFDDLASGDLDNLEYRAAPYRHRRHIQILMQVAGRDPRCTSRSEVGMCTAIVFALLFTGAWQITAVIIAARYELGFTEHPVVVALVALAVALAVVMFDWTIIQSHVQGGVSRKTWLTRTLFTLCMILLVSEVVTSAVFEKDINAQRDKNNAAEHTELQPKLAENQALQEVERQEISKLANEIAEAETRVNDLKGDLEREAEGYDRAAGEGDKWNDFRLKLEAAEQALALKLEERKAPQIGISARNDKIAELRQRADELRATADIREGESGPAEKEALLWAYMMENPSALLLKRIPLFVILVCLDLFALLIGLAVSRRTREMHDSWEIEQREWEVAGRFVRARVLRDAKTMIGRLVVDGMMGSAEQRARSARRRRNYRAIEEAVDDRREHRARIRAGEPAGPDITSADPLADTVEQPTAPILVEDEKFAAPVREGLKSVDNAPDVDGSADDGRTITAPNPGTEKSASADRRVIRLPHDPAEQSDEDLAPFLNQWYETDRLEVLAERRLDTAGSRSSRRATLLLGQDAQERHHVIKLFSVSGADGFANTDLSRDASNAQRMTEFSGGLGEETRRDDSWLAPSFFGTRSIADYSEMPDVPYLVMPYYPSGSVKEYLADHRGELTLDWCLRLTEHMFRACAQLAESHIVSCDAKLSNFVFARGAYSLSLTEEDRAAIGPMVDSENKPPDPIVRMIDLSMVYTRGQQEERPTRGMRGTEHWSSPRAMSGLTDELPHELTNLDDAFTVAINAIYLLTEREPPYPVGQRVALEQLGGGDWRDELPLIELSKLLARLADRREMGPGADDMLVAGRQWLRSRNLSEEEACSAAADMIEKIRGGLNPELVLHEPFRRLHFVEADLNFAKAS